MNLNKMLGGSLRAEEPELFDSGSAEFFIWGTQSESLRGLA
jgi:hypothetical protein